MNYEKKYKQALEKMKAWVEGKYPECFDSAQKTAELIFPELRESEDEKMMNQLHSWMKEFGGAEEYTEKVYQWIKRLLEKHKYTEEDLDKAYKCADEVQYRRGYEDAKKEIEKQGEVPVTINIDKMVEDYANDKECNNEGFGKPVNCMIRAYRQGITDTLVILNLRKQGEHNPADKIEQEYHCTGVREPKEATGVLKQLLNKENYAWSEEDEELFTISLDNLIELNDRYGEEYGRVGECIRWFKSIKDRVQTQSKQEWSEEDKVKINRIVAFLENLNLKYLNVAGNDILLKDIEWLKSFKDRYTWKPSEENNANKS